MNGTDDKVLLHSEVAQMVGVELRQARDMVGWTRTEFVARLPSEIHEQTLATYENGVRQCTLGRFVEICKALGVSAPDLLNWALQQAEIDLPTIGITVDLSAIIKDNQENLRPLRRWARARMSDEHASDTAHLAWSAVQEMAIVFGIPRSDFVHCLLAFTPAASTRAAVNPQ